MLLQGAAQRPQVQEVLVLLVDVQRDGRAALGAVGGLDLVFHAVLARPAHGGGVGVALGIDDHLVGHHKGAVEAQAEVADDAGALALAVLGVLGDEVGRAGEGHLGDVLDDLLLGHADAVVDEGERALLRIGDHVDAVGRIVLRLGLAVVYQPAILADGVAAVGDELAHEDVFIGIQPLLDDGHDILGVDGYGSLGHMFFLPWVMV